MSSLSVPSSGVARDLSASPLPMSGAEIPAPSASPMEDIPQSSSSSSATAPSSLASPSHPRPHGLPLDADEERLQFTRLYRSQLTVGEEHAVIPLKWFESWMAYTGFDRTEIDNGGNGGLTSPSADMTDADGAGAAAASSSSSAAILRRGGNERPGYMDCAHLLNPPPENVDLSTPCPSSSDGTLRTNWIELRQEVQEGVDFTMIPYDACLRLCEWYGGGPLIMRKVVPLGLSATPTIETHPVHLVMTNIVNGQYSLATRRIKVLPKSTLLSQVIDQCKPKNATPEEKLKLEGRLWKKRTTPLDPNVIKHLTEEYGADAWKPPALSSADRTSKLDSSQFIREWEVVSKNDYPHKLEFLELERGTEFLLEYRTIGEPWSVVGNGNVPSRPWNSLEKEDILDCCDNEGKWFQAQVVELLTDPVKGPCAKMHFINWNAKYDETIPLVPESFEYQPYTKGKTKFAPKHAHTLGPHIPAVPKKQVQDESMYHNSWNGFQRQNSIGQPEVRGAVGLRNLGNTCFMNSTLQCLANTPGLTEFFTEDKYVRYLNRTNPLGFKGKIAEEYGAMLKEIWSGQYSTVTPRGLKQVIGDFQSRFSGYQQQDSSELLSFLLDGLHEDLNRVLKKPITKPVESNDRPDAIVAQESWERHLQRNQSVIVDTCQGQLKSCVVCPKCAKQSITFDPFMFLTVPLPVPNTRDIPIIVVQIGAISSQPGDSLAPYIWPMRVSKDGIPLSELKNDVCAAVNNAPRTSSISPVPMKANCLITAEIYQSKIFKLLAPDFTTNKIGKQDTIVFYHIPEMEMNAESESFTTLQCIHQQIRYNRSERVGIPMVLSIPTPYLRSCKMTQLREIIRTTLNPWMNGGKGWQDGDVDSELYNIIIMDRSTDQQILSMPYVNAEGAEDFDIDIQGITNEYHQKNRTGSNGLSFALQWKLAPEQLAGKLLTQIESLTIPPHIAAAQSSSSKKTGMDLNDCLEAFSKEETLRKSEAWYCSSCKQHMEATKKMDLWSVPDILIIHLKRFFYDASRRDKIDTYVDFPLENFDLSPFIVNEDDKQSHLYDLYAVSNHYGGMGGGHYTAYAKNLVNKQWYNLDDSSATKIAQPLSVRTSAAYVLFYRRKGAKFNNL